MAILKNEYELSVWEQSLDSDGKKVEKKNLIFGSNTMSYLGRATSVKLKCYLKGTNTLTFSMPSKFLNPKTQKFEKNEFVDYLFDEALVKLKFKGRYFEFNVKQITEEKNYKSIIYNYECNDSFIDELSRTGYEIIFDEELYNNVDEIGNFMEITLENSIWDYRPDFNWGDFTEFTEERFYKIPLSLFGGKLKVHKINLNVDKSDIVNDEWNTEDKPWHDEPLSIKNPYSGDKRNLQYGDDLAREQRLFYDPYKGDEKLNPDNGRGLIEEEETLISNANDYIYVPYTDLQYIYGSFVADTYQFKATDMPAIYGSYQNNKKKYALQPYSQNPHDLIQLVYFEDNQKINIDESGTITNEDSHYVIRIEDWNEALVNKNKSLIFWSIDIEDYDVSPSDLFNGIYDFEHDGSIYYTVNVLPQTSLTDDFNWTPVYADGFLDKIGDKDVFAARKISITDRTEFNKKFGSYVSVYNNKSEEYSGKYSENDFNNNPAQGKLSVGYRVCSQPDTRVILPTLSKNLIQNGTQISDETGWESRTQKTNGEYDTGSYETLMEITARNTSSTDDKTGEQQDESVDNFYLQITSPYRVKTDDISLEGETVEDLALNFGLVGQEKNIEKDKVYAIRLITYDEQTGEKIINKDLDKVIIGQGSNNLEGNYTIAGYDDFDMDNYISFDGLITKNEVGTEYVGRPLKFLPNGKTIDNPNSDLIETHYHHLKNEEWLTNKTEEENSIEDNPFLLFKANQTIENPYVGLRVKSGPMTLNMEDISVDSLLINDGSGLLLSIKGRKDDGGSYYLDGVKIGINPITSTYYDKTWEEKANAYKSETATDGVLNADFADFASAEKKKSIYQFQATSSSTQRILFTMGVLDDKEDKTLVYAIYLNDEFFGIFWFSRNSRKETTQSIATKTTPVVQMKRSISLNTTKTFKAKVAAKVETTSNYPGNYRILNTSDKHVFEYYKTVGFNGREWSAGKSVPALRILSNSVICVREGEGNFRNAAWGFEKDSRNYRQDALNSYIYANSFNSLSKNSKITGTISGSSDDIFSLSWLNNKTGNNSIYEGDYFWFQSRSDIGAWSKVPCPLYNYIYFNMLDSSFRQRFNTYDISSHTFNPVRNQQTLGASQYSALKSKIMKKPAGFYFGIGYFDKSCNPIVGDYYLVLSRGQKENGHYSVSLVAEGKASNIISSLTSYFNRSSQSAQGIIKNGWVISCKNTGAAVGQTGIAAGPFYKVISTNTSIDGEEITIDKLKGLINADSASSGTGWNSPTGGESGSDTVRDFVPYEPEIVRDGSTIVSVNYITNYNLYDLHFRAANPQPEISENIRVVNSQDMILQLNVDYQKANELLGENAQQITQSNVHEIYLTNSTEIMDTNKFFKKIDERLEQITVWVKDAPESWYKYSIKPLIVKKEDFYSELSYSQLKNKSISLQQFFNYSTSGRQLYKVAFYKANSDYSEYYYNEDLTFGNFLSNFNEITSYLNHEFYNINLYLSQTPLNLNLYSFELFEAYTRGRDFVEFDYTELRPEEVNSKILRRYFKDKNYFVYKYSGREFDLTNYLTNQLAPTLPKNPDVKLALVHSKDLLQETDITLGNTYTYNRYFVEAIKYKDNGKTQYKDTFMVKDYVDAVGSTKYVDEDLEIITGNIDLLQCDYYYPQDATYENKWCDCRYRDVGATSKRECLYEKCGICPYLFETEKHPRKIRTLSVEKSNRFNIIQEISKVFEAYPQFYIEHDDRGKVLLDENGKMKKHVFFMTERGEDNPYGFRYEKNLSFITRSVDSNSITTKLFVENVDSELSKTGLCSIQTAKDNLGKNSYILDFSYYILKGILDKEQVQRDLYGIDAKTDLAFLPTIDYYNSKYDNLSNLITNVSTKAMIDLQANNIVKVESVSTLLEERKKIARTMYQFKVRALQTNQSEEDYTTSDTYINYLTKYKEYATLLWSNIEALFFSKNLFNYPINRAGTQFKIYDISNVNDLKEIFRTKSTEISDDVILKLKEKYCNGEMFWRLMLEGFDENDIKDAPELKSYNPPYSNWANLREIVVDTNIYSNNGLLGQYYSLFEQVKYWKKTRAKYLNSINEITEKFYKKYEPFLKEGTWTDDNYLTDNEYYWAAVNVLRDGCKPQTSYDISVVDLSSLPEYKDYTYELGDISFIEDIDFFGVNQETGLPNRQKVLISEIEYSLDSSSNDNTITVQNYTSQFDDLFEQISASVQSLTFNENTYKRASNFTATNILESDSLQGTLDQGNLTLLDTNNGNLKLDDEGTSGKGIDNYSSQYKITGEGIQFSKDGGATWDIGVSPKGINADYISAGQLDASKVQIMDSGYIYFLWDKSGITAYRNPSTSTSGLVDFTRFNKYGLSLIENNNVRLRAGYEFKTNSQIGGNYNATGNYAEEAELSNQNVGFYLYNDNGIPIFKTETASTYNDNSTDYSARLSMTGEMFITNDVLAGQNDGSAVFQQRVYKATGANLIKEYSANLLELMSDQNNAVISISENNREITSSMPEYQYLRSFPKEDRFFYVIWDDSKNNYSYFETDEGKYICYIYRLSYEQTNYGSEKYFLIDNKLYNSTNDASSPIKNYRALCNYYSLIFEKDQLADLETLIQDAIESFTPTSTFTPSYLIYQKNNNTNYQINGVKTIKILSQYVKDATAQITSNSTSAERIQYYDITNNNEVNGLSQKEKTAYPLKETYNSIIYNYWDTAVATTDIETTVSSNVKTQTVGVFINNKRLQASTDVDNTISEVATTAERINSTISGGAERIFTVCLKGVDTGKNNVVYKNIFSILKNGCAYFGGNIKNANKSNLDIESMDYLPDEIAIEDPSMVVINDGTVISDWEMMYDFHRNDSGAIDGISSQSLGEFLNALDSKVPSGGSGGTTSDTVSQSGYYLIDPLS